MLRTHTCGELRVADDGSEVSLAGWVNRRRAHGGLVFVDLRDRYGLTQIVIDPSETRASDAAVAGELGQEWVILVRGIVHPRPDGQANPDMATGEIEVHANHIEVLNPSRVPPFPINRDTEVDEALRLRHRYLDLRRPHLRDNLLLRQRITKFIRDYLTQQGFVEVETPILMKTTPEGARDFIVPSRLHPGHFYALPQSPQLLKQILMVAGLDRYFQIARCFRDEDPRADREFEFTQLDLEMTFVEESDIHDLIEDMLVEMVPAVSDKRIMTQPFPKLRYEESVLRYGNDKPGLRFGLEIVDASDTAAVSQFRVFSGAIEAGGAVRLLCAPGHFTRAEIDAMEARVKASGAGGLVWLECGQHEGGRVVRSPVAKFLAAEELDTLLERAGAKPGDTVLAVAGAPEVVADSLGRLRADLGRRLGLIDDSLLAFAWVIEPPLVEWNAEQARWDALHHPFTAPFEEDIERLESDPKSVRARAYDIVANGWELCTGSIRIHQRELQERVFKLIGLSPETAVSQFGFLLEAFEYGAPPHGGIAPGIDRIVALLAGEDNIRNVIAFPKAQSGIDVMSGAPSRASVEQLRELHIQVADSRT